MFSNSSAIDLTGDADSLRTSQAMASPSPRIIWALQITSPVTPLNTNVVDTTNQLFHMPFESHIIQDADEVTHRLTPGEDNGQVMYELEEKDGYYFLHPTNVPPLSNALDHLPLDNQLEMQAVNPKEIQMSSSQLATMKDGNSAKTLIEPTAQLVENNCKHQTNISESTKAVALPSKTEREERDKQLVSRKRPVKQYSRYNKKSEMQVVNPKDIEISTPQLVSMKQENCTTKSIKNNCNDKISESTNTKLVALENNKIEITERDKQLDSKKRQVKQNVSVMHIADAFVTPRAIASIPKALQVMKGAVVTKRCLSAGTRFGPVIGIHQEIDKYEPTKIFDDAMLKSKPVFLFHNANDMLVHIDVSDRDKSNWLGLLPLGTRETANLWLYEEKHQLFAVTTCIVGSRTKLHLGYCEQYSCKYRLPRDVPTINIVQVLQNSPREWRCESCGSSFSTPALLQRHIDLHHMENPRKGRRKRYQCRHCLRVFTRIFSLRRHSRVCLKKPPADQDHNSSNNKSNSTDNFDDLKLPSDESFQNILDFTNTIFDPDKSLPNLDISSSSKSDTSLQNNFNTSDVLNKIDNTLVNELNIKSKPVHNVEGSWTEKKAGDSGTCERCEEFIPYKNRKKHIRRCRARQFECGCGRTFRNKTQLSTHIHTFHPPDSQDYQQEENTFENTLEISTDVTKTITKEGTTKQEDTQNKQPENVKKSDKRNIYKCLHCKATFKRRGMYVNHFINSHPERPNPTAMVPVLKQVKHYLCNTCPKLYLTAAKRDQHILIHHPGVRIPRGASHCVEGAPRVARAAQCPACPRQYATRAKMLQHFREKHPHTDMPDTLPNSSQWG